MRKIYLIVIILGCISNVFGGEISDYALNGSIKSNNLNKTVNDTLADLIALDISFDQDTLMEGEPCKITFKLQNIGQADAHNFDLEAYITLDGDTDISDDFFVEKFEATTARAGYEYNAWFDLASFPNLGENIYSVGIVVILDSEEEVNEEDENNIYVTDVIYPAMDSPSTEIYSKDLNIPSYFGLSQNYPNPFNPSTTIEYSIPETGFVSLIVYDILANKVAELVNETKNSGRYKINFNAGNLTSGIYYYRFSVGNFMQTKKMLLVK